MMAMLFSKSLEEVAARIVDASSQPYSLGAGLLPPSSSLTMDVEDQVYAIRY